MSEVGRVVPDVEPIADLRPSDNVVAEGLVPFVRQRLAERALDAAQLDDDVGPGLGNLRRLPRVLVGQRTDGDVREFLLDVGSHRIDEAEHQARRTAFLLVDRGALGALAIAMPVVLRDRGDGRLGVGAEPFLEVLDQLFAHVLVRQAQLCVLCGAFALDLAEPFGMVGKVLLRRDQRIERVDEPLVDVLAAVLRFEAVLLTVGLVAHRPVRVEGVGPVGRAVLQRRDVADVELVHDDHSLPRDLALRRGPPSAAELVFEEGVDRVQRPSRPPARQDQVVADRLDDDPLGSESIGRKLGIGPFRGPRPDEDAGGLFILIVLRLEFSTGDLSQEFGQLGGRVLFGLGRIGGNHDYRGCLSVPRDRDCRTQRTAQGQNQAHAPDLSHSPHCSVTSIVKLFVFSVTTSPTWHSCAGLRRSSTDSPTAA